ARSHWSSCAANHRLAKWYSTSIMTCAWLRTAYLLSSSTSSRSSASSSAYDSDDFCAAAGRDANSAAAAYVSAGIKVFNARPSFITYAPSLIQLVLRPRKEMKGRGYLAGLVSGSDDGLALRRSAVQ